MLPVWSLEKPIKHPAAPPPAPNLSISPPAGSWHGNAGNLSGLVSLKEYWQFGGLIQCSPRSSSHPVVTEVSDDDGRGEGPGGVHGAAGVTDLPGTPRSAFSPFTTFLKCWGVIRVIHPLSCCFTLQHSCSRKRDSRSRRHLSQHREVSELVCPQRGVAVLQPKLPALQKIPSPASEDKRGTFPRHRGSLRMEGVL